ncbi:MAG: thiamine phosphate synthase [Synergistaceae bacterium]|nr:thiamine phosphate synthase [Synergistaceae bacterium]MBR0184483.1 thiamine phosphate synthase [Synergistaceae bacterium]
MKFSAESLRLYAVTDRTWLKGRTLADCVREAIAGGATMIQLREKNLGYEAFKYQALEIQALCRENHIPFIVNDNVNLACDISADGVHVGQSDMEAGNVRALIEPGKILGVSVRTADEAVEAERKGADYLGAGSVFHTGSKDDAVDITHEALREICRAVKIPVVAIGGINAGNIRELAGFGIEGVAVISAVFAADDIRRAASELRGLSDEISGHVA